MMFSPGQRPLTKQNSPSFLRWARFAYLLEKPLSANADIGAHITLQTAVSQMHGRRILSAGACFSLSQLGRRFISGLAKAFQSGARL
jgi:hypothetical protein